MRECMRGRTYQEVLALGIEDLHYDFICLYLLWQKRILKVWKYKIPYIFWSQETVLKHHGGHKCLSVCYKSPKK